jgi:PAP2 superfamily protein
VSVTPGWCRPFPDGTRPNSEDRAFEEDEGPPTRAVAGRSASRPLLLGEVAGVALLLFGYDRVAALANVHVASAVHHGLDLLRLERLLHFSVESPLNAELAAHAGLGRALAVYYDFAHSTVTFGVLLLLYVRRPAGYRQARWALIMINLIALVTFFLIPVAPPRLLPHAGFVDVVAHSGTWGDWEAGTSVLTQHADQYASMPSLHVASAMWVLLAVRSLTTSRGFRGLAALHLLATGGIVLSTGNHYVVDAAAGAVLASLAWRLASRSGLWARVLVWQAGKQLPDPNVFRSPVPGGPTPRRSRAPALRDLGTSAASDLGRRQRAPARRAVPPCAPTARGRPRRARRR